MKRLLIVCLIILPLLDNQAFAQDLVISKRSAKFFKPQELRELIYQKGWDVIVENRIPIPRSEYDRQYALLEKQLLEAVRPLLVRNFKYVEFATNGGDREVYVTQLSKAVRDAMFNTPGLWPLFMYDQTDRILSFKSDIHVLNDGTIRVTEYIKVYNGNGEQNYMIVRKTGTDQDVNNSIQRGIAREFPTLYTTREGLFLEVPFKVISVKVKGNPQSYFEDKLSNGVRIRIGDPDVILEEGIYEYMITYETGNQLVFHDNKDELYWNVNGNGWEFSADSVSATVTFPPSSKIFEQACYTGPQNSTAKDCNYKIINDSTIYFASNSRLEQYSGLTIAAAIQKGILTPPSQAEIVVGMIAVNWPLTAMVAVLVGLFLINLFNWFRVGRDAAPGVIYPQFNAPEGISPADAGYLYKQQFKAEQFSAALVDIAVRKGIRIVVNEEGKVFKSKTYGLLKNVSKSSTIESYVKKYYNWSLRDLWGQTIRKEYNSTIGDMYSALRNHLETQFRTDHENYSGRRGFFAWNAGAGAWGFILLAVLAFVSFIVIGTGFTYMHAIILAVLFVIGFVMQYIFYKIMPAMNREGRQVLDQIMGLRMYLTAAEERRYDKLQPPEKSLELFESLLPYAIALECQNEWSKKFEKIIADAVASKQYTPAYYDGDLRDMSTMSSSLSSGLSSTISSASTAPSEGGSDGSGGSDGGGSSGGGGGGGGGGGW